MHPDRTVGAQGGAISLATWKDLTRLLIASFEHTVDTGSAVIVTFSLPTGRSQQVVVTSRSMPDGTEWVVIESPVGSISQVDLTRLVTEVSEIVCGGVSRSQDLVTIRHCFPLENLVLDGFGAPTDLLKPLGVIAGQADRLERLLTSEDRW